MNSSAVRKRHRLRQLALSGQIAGDVFVVGGELPQFNAFTSMRIKYDCLLAKPIAGDRQRGRMVGIAADEHKSVSFVEPQVRRAFEKSVEKVEAVNIYNGFHFVTLYKTLEPGLLPAPHRIAVAQRVVSNPSWGS